MRTRFRLAGALPCLALGVRLAHSLPVGKLKRVFALLLFVMGTKMLIGLF